MSILIHNIPEGASARQGINWRRDKASTLILCLLVWKFGIYFRIRSPWITSGGEPFANRWARFKYKYILDAYWNRPTKLGPLEYDFMTKSFRFRNSIITQEALCDYIERESTYNERIQHRS